MSRVVLPEQIILVGQSLNLDRQVIEQFPKFPRSFRLHSAGFGKGRLLPVLYSLFAVSLSRSNFPPGSASFFICRSQSSSSTGLSNAASSQRSSGVSRSIASLSSSTRLMPEILTANSTADKTRQFLCAPSKLNPYRAVAQRSRTCHAVASEGGSTLNFGLRCSFAVPQPSTF